MATDVTRRAYTNSADAAAVVLYTVQGGGHTSLMWAFFLEHPLRPIAPTVP